MFYRLSAAHRMVNNKTVLLVNHWNKNVKMLLITYHQLCFNTDGI